MTIPVSHSTTTGSLLQSRSAKSLLGDYPSDLFSRVETKRPLPSALSLTPLPLGQIRFPDFSDETAAPLVDNYFYLVSPQQPILNRDDFEPIYQEVCSEGLRANLRSSLVLVVLALGKAAVATPDLRNEAWLPGVELFTPALQVLLKAWFDEFGDDILLPQGLYLAALYYSYLSRPLQTWRLVHMASTSIQHFPIRHRSMQQLLEETVEHQPVTRLCWAAFILECDIAAEHHLPRSGIDQVIENLSFPRVGNPPEPELLYWLANISARRLLNRIHHVMYDTATSFTTRPTGDVGEDVSSKQSTSLFTVATELSHQLGAWFELLPAAIKPDLNNPDPSVDEAIVMLRPDPFAPLLPNITPAALMHSTARHIAKQVATHPETKSFAKSIQRNMASGTPSETAKAQASSGSDAPSFESIGVKNTDIVQKSGVSLSSQQKVLVGSVLDLFEGNPTLKHLSLWSKNATFQDNITVATGFDKYAAQWYGLPALFDPIRIQSHTVTSAGNPIEFQLKNSYTVKGIKSEQTMESVVQIEVGDDGKIVKVNDKWNNDLPDGAFSQALRKLNAVTVPAFVKVPKNAEEDAKLKAEREKQNQ
ncbi:hypothetical protein C8035_v009476 [Colletotrichum spinosum]|uniref:Xylanolytic transcriptional activator regulatory domain-containing protein n=1 Tax=Colletotrichum spinosum TaxID=1347390 RepID=A0A4R8PQ61_9PEZI|nr:hypothetical protein C8035_v009476 [Colletotrichum spinosum]